MTRLGIMATLVAAAIAFAGPLAAETYPARPITMIVPFGPGGGSDIVSRAVADELSRVLGQSIIVETRPGANGAIGSAVVARAAPDGYTLLSTASSSYALTPNLSREPLFDQIRDLVPVAAIGRSPWLVAVPAEGPFRSIADIVTYGKSNPNKLAFPFWQSSVLVTGATFARLGGFEMRKVPYKGRVEATTDLLGGRLPLMVLDIAGGLSPVEAGKVRLLATTTAERIGAFPDLPTMREQGLDVVTDSMSAVFAPAGTPRAVAERLNAEINRIVASSPKVRERLRQLGLEPVTMTLPEVDAFVRSELVRWAELIDKAGLKKE